MRDHAVTAFLSEARVKASEFVLTGPDGTRFAALPAFVARMGVDPKAMPRSILILLEAALRAWANGSADETAPRQIVQGVAGVDTLSFPIGRILLQDAAGIPLLVDLAAMRDAVVAAGKSPDLISPLVPVAMVIDHSVQSDHYGTSKAIQQNLHEEFANNSERYAFVKWAQQAFAGLTVVPPGNGIVHQVHMELLAEVVSVRDGWVFCDTVIGTDSHTTMVNGLGVVGWGVGGIEAEATLLGELFEMSRPETIGIEIVGRPVEGVLAADVALTLTQWFRSQGVVGCFLEFFGDGLDYLSVEDRCTIANMAPEYGATLALFPTDDDVMRWLRGRGRDESAIEAMRAHLQRQGLFGRSGFDRIAYDRRLSFELSDVVPCVAGPTRPDQKTALGDLKDSVPKGSGKLDGRVVLAAITSCTNTANPASMIAAGLLARNARAAGLQIGEHIKTVLAPGSREVTHYLSDLGLLEPLEQLGFFASAYGCAVCVGNSGSLSAGVEDMIQADGSQAVAVLSGNRNFEARVHPAVRSAYLMNPALVVAFALAGRADIDLSTQPIGRRPDGRETFLADLWPSAREIESCVSRLSSRAMDLVRPQEWNKLPVSEGGTFSWDPASTYFVPPPFFSAPAGHGKLDIVNARPLLVLGDGVTTDHISPVGRIGKSSLAAGYLKSIGVNERDLNTYAARRGNHHVMARGTFANERLQNLLLGGQEGSLTRHIPSGDIDGIYTVAERYKAEGRASIIVAGVRYGSGSARDWAAKGTALLGVRAVIARTFERIHRSNLVRLGVLPVQLVYDGDAIELGRLTCRQSETEVGVRLEGDSVRPKCIVSVSSGEIHSEFEAIVLIETAAERSLLELGDLFRATLTKALERPIH